MASALNNDIPPIINEDPFSGNSEKWGPSTWMEMKMGMIHSHFLKLMEEKKVIESVPLNEIDENMKRRITDQSVSSKSFFKEMQDFNSVSRKELFLKKDYIKCTDKYREEIRGNFRIAMLLTSIISLCVLSFFIPPEKMIFLAAAMFSVTLGAVSWMPEFDGGCLGGCLIESLDVVV